MSMESDVSEDDLIEDLVYATQAGDARYYLCI